MSKLLLIPYPPSAVVDWTVGEWYVWAMLHALGGKAESVSSLADKLVISKSSTAQVVERLETRNLVKTEYYNDPGGYTRKRVQIVRELLAGGQA